MHNKKKVKQNKIELIANPLRGEWKNSTTPASEEYIHPIQIECNRDIKFFNPIEV